MSKTARWLPTAQTKALRISVGESELYGKNADGYRNILGALCEDGVIYFLYDAVFNIVEQRRSDDFSAVGNGYTVQFTSAVSSQNGTSTYIYTLHQLWLDVIDADNNVVSALVNASVERQNNIQSAYTSSTLVSTDGEVFHYVTDTYSPDLGAAYTKKQDLVYIVYYPVLSVNYPYEYTAFEQGKSIVHYRTYLGSNPATVAINESVIILPDMQLLSKYGNTYSVTQLNLENVPVLENAVQHFGRLFGICGTKIFASKFGSCTDFTLPESGSTDTSLAWISTAQGKNARFTAIASFDGKIVAFTDSSMMTVFGNELPFELSFEGGNGCVGMSALAIHENYMYFVSQSGVMRYNGSSVSPIGRELPITDYGDSSLAVCGGMLVLHAPNYGGLFLYDIESGGWTFRIEQSPDVTLLGNAERFLCGTDGQILPYEIFGQNGAFSFDLNIAFSSRRRIVEISVTAFVESGSFIELCDKSGNPLLTMDGAQKTYTASVMPRGFYLDSGCLHFEGGGRVTVYNVTLRYADVRSRKKRCQNR